MLIQSTPINVFKMRQNYVVDMSVGSGVKEELKKKK